MKNNLPKKSAAKPAKSESGAKKPTASKAAKTPAVPAKKAVAPAKKAAVKKAPAATAKPATTKVITATKTSKAKTPAAPKNKTPLETTFVAQVEIGWGNSLYLRGEGAPELSWERGILMKWLDGSWVYSTTDAKQPVCFKYLVNDQIWADGNNQRIEPGTTSITSPHFHH